MIQLITGPMYSGKSDEIVRLIHDDPQGYHLVLKPRMGQEDAESWITSRSGRRYPCKLIVGVAGIKHALESFQVAGKGSVYIDEAQFIDPSLADLVADNAQHDWFIAGLDLDFNGRPWATTEQSKRIAHRYLLLRAVCARCGELATHSAKTKGTLERVQYEAPDVKYAPMCYECWKTVDVLSEII